MTTKESVINRSVEVFGSLRIANGWLNLSLPELDGGKPADLLATWYGREHLLAILNAIACGD